MSELRISYVTDFRGECVLLLASSSNGFDELKEKLSELPTLDEVILNYNVILHIESCERSKVTNLSSKKINLYCTNDKIKEIIDSVIVVSTNDEPCHTYVEGIEGIDALVLSKGEGY
ncbi:hypothetical protein [Labrenzia sp. OB1]|uniref:hypothetical protein n=1 Tax=Labrenzia sp. OB1 TaxID=1561204 RepID=UPI000A41D665|nr:hypothetical protein [Labrenzia sp. OB1]